MREEKGVKSHRIQVTYILSQKLMVLIIPTIHYIIISSYNLAQSINQSMIQFYSRGRRSLQRATIYDIRLISLFFSYPSPI